MSLEAPVPETPGPVVFEILSGSRAYGTDGPDSDHDWRGVFLLPNAVFLGLDPAKTTWEDRRTEQVFWELGHFCRLLLKGNPNIVSMLSALPECVVVEEPAFEGLRDVAPRLVTQDLRSAYVGWVNDEMRRISKSAHGPDGERGNSKRLSHVPRLIWEYEAALVDGVLPIRLKPDQVEYVRAIKFGATPYAEAFDEVAQMVLDLEAMDERLGPGLPGPPTEEVREWLVRARRLHGDQPRPALSDEARREIVARHTHVFGPGTVEVDGDAMITDALHAV